jgi:hypothetical protein
LPQKFHNGEDITKLFNTIQSDYSLGYYCDVFGYNGGMEKISDSGRSSRYNKLLAVKDKELDYLIANAKKYEYTTLYKHIEYEELKGFSTKILKDTGNYKEKAIVFDSEHNIVFEKLGFTSHVVFTKEELKKMRGNSLIHNHPSGMTLSEADVRLAVDHGLSEIVAFGGKSNYYRLVIKENKDHKEIMIKYNKSKSEVISVLYRLFTDGKITKRQIEQEYQHLVMSLFSSKTKDVSYENKKN